MALAAAMDAMEGRDLRWMGTAASEKALPTPLAARFGALVFRLPALQERTEDLVPVFNAMLRAEARSEGRPDPLLERSVERELVARAWPGNLKALRDCAQASFKLLEGTVLRRLPPVTGEGPPLQVPWPPPGEFDEMLRAVGRAATPALLLRTLEAEGGDVARAAASLGLSVRVLASRLREHGISLEDRDP